MKTMNLMEIMNGRGIVGRDARLHRAIFTALQVAPTDLSVLIQGENGTGKEAIPRLIHDNSLRRGKRYIAINCGSIPEGTIDSELFGHEKGSFTGAVGEHEGYFGAANRGTLFLDEVGELPLSTQARLLRVLETGEYLRVGSNEPRKTDVRIVAATNVDMERAIGEGRFREDLYYRLCTISIPLPPLRERGEDVLLLFRKFAMDTARRYNIPTPLRLTPEAEQVMLTYQWPGNIRQLRNVTEQMSILCGEQRMVTPETLAEYNILPGARGIVAGKGTSENYDQAIPVLWAAINSLKNELELIKSHLGMGDMTAAPVALLSPPPAQAAAPLYDSLAPTHSEPGFISSTAETYVPPVRTHSSLSGFEVQDVEEEENLNLAQMEREMIEKALRKHRGRRRNAAQELGISERTLYRKIEDYGIKE